MYHVVALRKYLILPFSWAYIHTYIFYFQHNKIASLLPIRAGARRYEAYILISLLLKTTNIEIIKYCQEQFDFHLPSVLIARRTTKFLSQIAGYNS